MNTLNIMTVARNRWFHLGVVAIGVVLLASAIALGLAMSVQLKLPQVSGETASAPSAAQLRYEDFKLNEIERREFAPRPASAPSAAQLRYEDFKLRQVEMMEP